MKIVTWNCNGALRNKTACIDALGADIIVVQECENPELSTKAYRQWAGEYLWHGENKNKGIGVFPRNGNKIRSLKWQGEHSLKGITNKSPSLFWESENLQSFLPLKINEKFTLLAIWTKKADSPNFGYIGQFWKYLQIHKRKLTGQNIILCGDLNSNAIWDETDRWWSHTDVVRELKDINIYSLYHYQTQEAQGEEIQKTFYMYRKYARAYHIDYVFLSNNLLAASSLILGEFSTWIEYSDHVPAIFTINA